MTADDSATTVLAFDLGSKYLGVAVGQTITQTASALTHMTMRDGSPPWEAIESLLQQWQPQLLVVGLPLNMDGSESDMSRKARRFANRLHGRFGLPVHCQDERLSSFEARSRIDSSLPSRRQGGAIDSMAASVILEHWLLEQG
jgi:putative Holliday junction resolvase